MAAELPDVYVRLEGIKGDCTDELHPGAEGWVQINRFSFGFGLNDTNATNTTRRQIGGRGVKPEEQVEQLTQVVRDLQNAQNAAQTARNGQAGTRPPTPRSDGPLNFRELSMTKSLDVSSSSVWDQHCHHGKIMPQLEVVACRYGGVGTKAADIKIPFLRMVFETVRITKVSLSLSNDDLPSETITLDYDRVRMEYLWTDNETGERVGDRPCRAGWDREKSQAWLGE